MSNVKISQLPEASAVTADDLFPFVKIDNEGRKLNKKISVTNFFSNINTNLTFNPDNASGLLFTVNGSSGQNDLLRISTTNNRIGIKNSSPSELLHISNGNLKIGGFDGVDTGILISSKEKLLVPNSDLSTTNLLTSTVISEINLNGSSVITGYTYKLGVGSEGQYKVIYITDEGPSFPSSFIVYVKPDTGVSFVNVASNGIVMNKKGASVLLYAITSTKWVILGSNYAQVTEG